MKVDKKKVKDFIEEHKSAIVIASFGVIMYTVGYKTGANNETRLISRGLEKCIKVNPELESVLWDSIRKAQG